MDELNDQQREELIKDLVDLEASLIELLDLTQSKTKPVSLRENIGRLSPASYETQFMDALGSTQGFALS